ncbi:ribosome maturation factor RimM [Cohnella sp. CIP 111063]|uniref:ribosome maturation factor RimM n=1 Tax=unclassified Cohnella TaxID=2636738 RepID=UPI000B8C11CE|nr:MULTISPECIES: ribosome maturation factor RimM [unclassified Cohnella]OXS52592.1 ribosome maturation factor RimM [Cohnella sp. CIP 111063]PRX58854.1 16S rRNA processing protein RimM [Cohnella sp. SGD-V74]
MSEGRLLNVGKIVNTHGIKGELKVWPQTDFPEVRFKAGNRLLMIPPEAGNPITVEIVSAREQKKMYVVKIKGFDNINDVEKYKGWELKVPEEDRVPLEEGEYYVRDIVGCEVFTEEGELLGTVTDTLSPGANDIWVVKMPKGKELLLPVIDDVVLDVDVAARKIKVHLMEGLL